MPMQDIDFERHSRTLVSDLKGLSRKVHYTDGYTEDGIQFLFPTVDFFEHFFSHQEARLILGGLFEIFMVNSC